MYSDGIKKLDHINIVVENIDKTVDFYAKVFDFQVKSRRELTGEWFDSLTGVIGSLASCVAMENSQGNFRIEFLEYKRPEGKFAVPQSSLNYIGVRHVAFEVDNILDYLRRFESYGGEKLSDIVSVPIALVPKGKRLCYLKAPDDVIIELLQYS